MSPTDTRPTKRKCAHCRTVQEHHPFFARCIKCENALTAARIDGERRRSPNTGRGKWIV